MRRASLLHKLKTQTYICPRSGCWIWTGATSGSRSRPTGGGYGRVSIDGAMMAVHRVAYTHFFGIIPHKKQVDHECRQRRCWNPAHLELTTHKQNCRRRDERLT